MSFFPASWTFYEVELVPVRVQGGPLTFGGSSTALTSPTSCHDFSKIEIKIYRNKIDSHFEHFEIPMSYQNISSSETWDSFKVKS